METSSFFPKKSPLPLFFILHHLSVRRLLICRSGHLKKGLLITFATDLYPFFSYPENCFFLNLQFNMNKVLAILLFLSTQTLFAQSNQFQMDGFFEDWENIDFIEKEANPSTSIDLVELSASNDEHYLYLRIQLDREILFQQGEIRVWIDTDNNSGTGQGIRNIGSELYYHFGQRQGRFKGQDIGHFDISLVSMPTYSSDEFEVRIQRQGVMESNTIQIIVSGESLSNDALPTSGSLSFTFEEGPFASYTSTDIAKENPDFIRLMNYNILFDRPLEPAFRNQFERIVQAVDADIFCFNEFFESSSTAVKGLMDSALPLNNGTGWYATKVDGDNVTVSRYPILQVIDISPVGNMSANLIDLPEAYNTDLLVIVCHFSCCDQETERQLQVDAVAAFIEEAKNPGGRITIEEGTPIIVTGDFNMVGFQQQRTTLLTGDIQNTTQFGTAGMPDWDNTPITDLLPFHTENPIATTWINPFSSFAPGRLDYILYSDSRLEAKKSFVLKTDDMPATTLSDNGLRSGDTDFSDHLPIVGDFQIVDLTTPVDEVTLEKKGVHLDPAYPNPMSSTLNIPFQLSQAMHVQLQMLSLDGRLIETVVDEVLPAGAHLIEWENEDFSPGMYWYRFITEKGTVTRALVKQ
jgi:endonuclease/exonuclease/phosphatase family metal-dependent hydrolase